MADVIVVGGAVGGLATAMMLARDGHDVTVLERDPHEVRSPDEAWESWERKGVAQFRLAHYLHPRFRIVMQDELPEVGEAMEKAGAFRFDLVATMPSSITDRTPRDGDDRLWTLTGRRAIIEYAFASVATSEPRVTVERGVHVTGLVTNGSVTDGVPHVVGVQTEDGERRADLVVDAMGRRSFVGDWIEAAGGRRPPEESAECGFTYYGRHYVHDTMPEVLAPLLVPYGSISILTLPCDNGIVAVAVYAASGDRPLRMLRHPDRYERVVRSCTPQAHWIDGVPVGDMMALSGVTDRIRSFVVDGEPVVTGLLPVADAWACTNPSLGRGLSLGIWHAQRLRDVVRDHLDDYAELADTWHAVTMAELEPYYRMQVDMDRSRHAEIDAIREGREPPPDPSADIQRALGIATQRDPDVFRAFSEIGSCLSTPEEVMGRPGLFEKVLAAADGGGSVEDPPGPTREQLLEICA